MMKIKLAPKQTDAFVRVTNKVDIRMKYVAFELYAIVDFMKRYRYPVELIKETAKALTSVANVERKLRG